MAPSFLPKLNNLIGTGTDGGSLRLLDPFLGKKHFIFIVIFAKINFMSSCFKLSKKNTAPAPAPAPPPAIPCHVISCTETCTRCFIAASKTENKTLSDKRFIIDL